MGIELEYKIGQTPLDEEEIEGLLLNSIKTQQELDEHEQLNIEKAIEWSIGLKLTPEKIFDELFIKKVHEKMFDQVWKWAGRFRQSEKNMGVQWTLISIELRKLLADTLFWIENKTFSEDEIAIMFKHRLVSIHCFSNGNGRHSRLMADIIAKTIFKSKVFSWNQSSLAKADDARKEYITAIKAADDGKLERLIAFARK